MARASSSSTKFASVNLNKSYGKPAVPQGTQLPGSGGSRARIASHGGMLLLTRPVRSSQPTVASAVLQKSTKLTVPLPVNLPSLRREHAGNDPNIALVGVTGAPGWPKQQQHKEVEEAASSDSPKYVSAQGESNNFVSRFTPALSAGSTWATSQYASAGQPEVIPSLNGELRPSSAPHLVARSGVYTPPRARIVPVKVNALPTSARTVSVERAVVLRGEDFPTLQASLPPAPPTPKHRQRDLQHKQRGKQLVLKDQHQKLQLLSQKFPEEEPRVSQQVVGPPLQPAQPLSSVKPQASLSLLSEGSLSEGGLSLAAQQPGSRPLSKQESFSSYCFPASFNQRSNWTDDEREPAQMVRPQGSPGRYSEWPDRPDRERFLEDARRNSRGEDYGFGRQSSLKEHLSLFGTGSRESGIFGSDAEFGREGGFSTDGVHPREGNHSFSYSNHSREERYGREVMHRRDGASGREGGYWKDGGYNNRESGMSRDNGVGREAGYGRQGTYGRDNFGAWREFVPGKDNYPDRDGFGRPAVGAGEFTTDRESYSFRDGVGKDGVAREAFYKDSSFERHGNLDWDGPYRGNRRSQNGDYDGGRGRFGDGYGRGGGGRFNGGSEFNGNKGVPLTSGRGILGLDCAMDFNREKRFGAPYSEDAFARDFPDLPGLDFRTATVLGESLSGVESKLTRRKKEEAKVSAFYDLEREAFEAELERVQKLQEQERLRKLEERERAIEQSRKEQEEQDRLAKDEVERQVKLEEQAREAAVRAEQEAVEAARKVQVEKQAREKEKKSVQLEEERRKENARRKLLELEERIAKREAEKKQKEETALVPEGDRFRNQRKSLKYEAAAGGMVAAWQNHEQDVASLTGADEDDDERAPLRPSRLPQADFSSRLNTPDVQGIARLRTLNCRGANSFEAECSRPVSSWRRDFMHNGVGSTQTSLYGGREDISETQSFTSRDRMSSGRVEYSDREAFHWVTQSSLMSDGGRCENPAQKERVSGSQERMCVVDETGSSSKRSGSPRAATPESEVSYVDRIFDRKGDRHWGRAKIDRQRFGDAKRLSPPPPPSSLHGAETVEISSYGRLRQSLAKQPRVPPLPLRGTPFDRPHLKSARDLANSSPSPLLHTANTDGNSPSWPQDGALESHLHLGSPSSGNHLSEDSTVDSKKMEFSTRETTVFVPEKSQGRELQGLIGFLRPQRSYLQSAKGSDGVSQDEDTQQRAADAENETSALRDDSSFFPKKSPVERNEQDGEGLIPHSLRMPMEGKSEEGHADYFNDEQDVGTDDEDYENEVDLDDEGDLEDEFLDNELHPEDERDLGDVAAVHGEDVSGDWDDDVAHLGNEKRSEDPGALHISGEHQEGSLDYDEGIENDMDFNEYVESREHDPEDTRRLKIDHSIGETAMPESVDSTQQENDLSYHSVPQPYMQHVASATPGSLTTVLPVAQGENYASQVRKPPSFVALSLPQSHGTGAMLYASSFAATLPILQNAQEDPMTLQFGRLPVPAIQIGSIQMPLHLHPLSGAQILGSQAPLFQFGQLGLHTPLPSADPLPLSQSQVQPQNANSGVPQLNGTVLQETHVPDLLGREPSTSLVDQVLPPKSTRASLLGQAVVGDMSDANSPERETRGRSGFLAERSGDRSLRDGGTARHVKVLQQVDPEGTFESPSLESSITAGTLFENSSVGDSSWNRSYATGRGRSNGARWPCTPLQGKVRSGSSGGKVSLPGFADGSSVSTANCSVETVMDGAARMRPSRRSNNRRTEFKVRDSTMPPEKAFPDRLEGTKQTPGREKYSHAGWNEGTGASGVFSDSSLNRDGHEGSASRHQDRKYYGDPGHSSPSVGVRSSQSGVSKNDRLRVSNSPFKNGGRASGYSASRPSEGVLGRYYPEVTSNVSPLEQPGVELPSDEDDFIEVRSKRQMLNDRREQKEKEMKAKTKDMKVKEQGARKQRSVVKGGFQRDSGVGSKTSGLTGPVKRPLNQSAVFEASNSSDSHLCQSVISLAVVSSTSLPASNNPAQLPPIGTPAGGSADTAFDKRSKNSQSRINSSSGGNLTEVDVPASSAYDNQDVISGTPNAWGGTRSTLQVVSLTQIQLEEAMKPVRFESPGPQQISFVEHSSLVLEPVTSVSSATIKEKTFASPSGPLGSLLAGEKIQFGAVTSPSIPMPSSRTLTPGLNAVVGSVIGARGDGGSDENELRNNSKRLSGGGNEVSSFPGKTKRTRGDVERDGDGIYTEDEAEAAASAVAVAAISSDESVGSTHHGDGQNLCLRGVGLAGSGNKTSFGKSSVTGSHTEYWPADTGISIGDGNTSSVMMQVSGLEVSMPVALPADLSVEPTAISHQGLASNASGLLHPSLPGGPLAYRGLEMGTMLGGTMFGFGTSKEVSQGPQGATSGSGHDQGISSSGSGPGGWQPQHSGGVDSYYAGPPSSYAGPFINHACGIPNIQGPPHMLVYTNPFASVGQFGQLGVSFMGPQQYLPSGKLPDWKHTPVSSSGIGMSGCDGGLGGIMSSQRSSGLTNNVQRMAPGHPVLPTPGPFDLNPSASFQIPAVEVSMQSQWSHVPGPSLHPVPISGPILGFAMQSRHPLGPSHIGHLPHMVETTSGLNLAPASIPVSSAVNGLFQSVDPAAQFPDELGLGDSISAVTNSSSSFQGQRPSNRVPPVSSSVPALSVAAGAATNISKLRSGRRPSRVAKGVSSLGVGGNGGISISDVGIGPSSGSGGQVPNGSRAPSPHLQTSQMPPLTLGQHSHPSPYADQRGSTQQGLARVGIPSGVWSGQGRKSGGPGRPTVSERGPLGDKNFVSSSSKLKQVYVVKPSSSPRRNIDDSSTILFSGTDVGQTAVGH